MNDAIIYSLYDVVTKKTIHFYQGELANKAKTLNLIACNISSMSNPNCPRLCLQSRYILPENKHRIFTLVDFETGEEFDCINNKTLSYYFNKKLSLQESRSICELKTKRQFLSTLFGKVFYLKGRKPSQPLTKTKSEHLPVIKQYRKEVQLKQKITNRLYCRLAFEIKKSLAQKSGHTLELLGCSWETFKSHIESKFQKGMNWDNHGLNGWHIDHIRPCCSFNLLNEKEQKECFHYTNLQPLWAKDNMIKGNNERMQKFYKKNIKLNG